MRLASRLGPKASGIYPKLGRHFTIDELDEAGLRALYERLTAEGYHRFSVRTGMLGARGTDGQMLRASVVLVVIRGGRLPIVVIERGRLPKREIRFGIVEFTTRRHARIRKQLGVMLTEASVSQGRRPLADLATRWDLVE